VEAVLFYLALFGASMNTYIIIAED